MLRAIVLVALTIATSVWPLRAEVIQYSLRTWQTDDGLPQNNVQALLQTRAGYLWIGTPDGLARFDGARFTAPENNNFSGFRTRSIASLCEARDATLWIAAEGLGIIGWKEGGVQILSTTNGLPNDSVKTIFQSSDGALWIGTSRGLSRWNKGKFSNFTQADGLANNAVRGIAEDRAGNLWIGTGDGLSRFKDGRFTTIELETGLLLNSIRAVCVSHDDVVWIGSNGGLTRLENGRAKTFTQKDGLTDNMVSALFEDRKGQLWIGTYGGLDRCVDGKLIPQMAENGLSFDAVFSMGEDREGDIWIGSKGGLSRLSPQRVTTLSRQQGLTHNSTVSICADKAGSLWIGTWGGGLNRLRNGEITALTESSGLGSDLVLALHEARNGALWVGLDYDRGLNRWQDGKFTLFDKNNGLLDPAVSVICETRDGALWLGTRTALNCFQQEQFTRFTITNGLAGNQIHALAEDDVGTLWIGTDGGLSCWKEKQFTSFKPKERLPDKDILSIHPEGARLWLGTKGSGVSCWRDGKFTSYTTAQGLFSDVIYAILDDGEGNFWMSSPKGIFCVGQQQFTELDDGVRSRLACISYGKVEGMLSTECRGVAQPAACKTHDGRLWFPTAKGVVAIDPKIKPNGQVPPVRIEEVIADGQRLVKDGVSSLKFPQPIIVPPGRGEFEFHYTALSFAAPEKCHFKYRLEGVDRDWVDGRAPRLAHYNNIYPGSYRFQVIACNNDGLWNEQGAVVSFILRPHYWQTWWFMGLATTTGAGAVGGTARFVTKRKLRRKLELLERQHALEKERARIAKDIHDDLGAGLTQITLLSDLTHADADKTAEVEAHAKRISSTAREMVQSLDEIVWAVSPRNDTLESLVEYLSRFADEFFESSSIRCWLEVPPQIAHCVLPAEVRHNLFLAFKEALNNVAKHSGASAIKIKLVVESSKFQVVIADNGKGFDPTALKRSGNGLGNMPRRLAEIGGAFEIRCPMGEGTEIRMTIPVKVG